MNQFFGKRMTKVPSETDSDHWISVSDMMSGLMMVFLFISIAFMMKVTTTAKSYEVSRNQLYEALREEFKDDLLKWNASVDKETLSFQFNAPDILFSQGSANIRPQFKDVLINFFPRYMKVLAPFMEKIEEVRIEGHTSTQWGVGVSADDAYYKNMELSQARTRSVLLFVQGLADSIESKKWIRKHIAAVGLSSSRPVMREKNESLEDEEKSRRVNFRVMLNADEQLRNLMRN